MDQLESLLRQLCGELRKTLDTINENDDVIQRLLHDPSQLPTKRLNLVASETIDLLNSVERSLTPSTLVLADHFLGESAYRAPIGSRSLEPSQDTPLLRA